MINAVFVYSKSRLNLDSKVETFFNIYRRYILRIASEAPEGVIESFGDWVFFSRTGENTLRVSSSREALEASLILLGYNP